LGELDHVTRTHDIRRNIHALAIDQHTIVAHDLARFGTRATEAHAIGNGVETTFEQLQQVLAGLTATAIGLGVHLAELALEHAIKATNLLLFTQLHAVARQTLTGALAMLTRRIGAALDGALVGETLFGLQKQLFAFATALTALGIEITSHLSTPCQIRRFFGGRQPLCGMGVMSVMLEILIPSALSARTDDSRPGPGPLIRTSRFLMPHSRATF